MQTQNEGNVSHKYYAAEQDVFHLGDDYSHLQPSANSNRLCSFCVIFSSSSVPFKQMVKTIWQFVKNGTNTPPRPFYLLGRDSCSLEHN